MKLLMHVFVGVIVTAALWSCAGSGEVEVGTGKVAAHQPQTTLTYNDIYGSRQLDSDPGSTEPSQDPGSSPGTGGDNPADDYDEGGNGEPGDQPAQEDPPVEAEADVAVAVVSTCHAGEIDMLLAVDRTNQDGGTEERAIISLEAEAGPVLGHCPLDIAEIHTATQALTMGTVTSFSRALEMVIPGNLAEAGKFRANLFVCYDLNANGSCADEQVSEIGDLEDLQNGGWAAYMSRVVSLVPIEVSVAAGAVSFTRLAATQSDRFGEAANLVGGMLANLDPGAYGLQDEGLGVVLAAKTTDPDCPTIENRTDGCFVAGTPIRVAANRYVPVEKLSAGMVVITADGRRVAIKRVVAGPEPKPIVSIRTADGHALSVTSEHPVLTLGGIRPARELTLTDRLVNESGGLSRVASLSSEDYTGLVYNFELPGEATHYHLVVSAGLVTGDLYLQEQRPKLEPLASLRP